MRACVRAAVAHTRRLGKDAGRWRSSAAVARALVCERVRTWAAHMVSSALVSLACTTSFAARSPASWTRAPGRPGREASRSAGACSGGSCRGARGATRGGCLRSHQDAQSCGGRLRSSQPVAILGVRCMHSVRRERKLPSGARACPRAHRWPHGRPSRRLPAAPAPLVLDLHRPQQLSAAVVHNRSAIPECFTPV